MTDPICSVDKCHRPPRLAGLCGAHHQRLRVRGDVMADVPIRTAPGEPWQFYLAHVYDVTPACIIWPYSSSNGYGVLERTGKQHSVHHLACQAWHGPRPAGMIACHGPCHRKMCFNGQHVSWGTPRENMTDQRRDGTAMLGAKNHATKLTADQVTEIRRRYALGGTRQVDLATEFGIKQPALSALLRRVTWNHIP